MLKPDIRHIRPAPDRKMRHPGTNKVLAAEGEDVTWSSYWQRALAAGDIEKVTPERAAPPAPAKPTSEAN